MSYTQRLRERYKRFGIKDNARLRALAGAPELQHSLTMPEPVLRAATHWVQQQERRADAADAAGPLWHGWALHAAFVAGVFWALQQHEDQEQEQEKRE